MAVQAVAGEVSAHCSASLMQHLPRETFFREYSVNQTFSFPLRLPTMLIRGEMHSPLVTDQHHTNFSLELDDQTAFIS